LAHLGLGPEVRAIRAGSIGRDISLAEGKISSSAAGGGGFFPPHPRRNHCLLMPSELSWLSGLRKPLKTGVGKGIFLLDYPFPKEYFWVTNFIYFRLIQQANL